MVNTIRTRTIILSFAVHLVGGICLAQQGAPAGHVEALEGTATIQRQGTLEHIPVRVGDDVYPQDFIQTSRDAKMRILLNDGSVLTIGVEGRLRFNRYSVEGNQSGRVILNLLSGALQVVAQWLPCDGLTSGHRPQR